MSHKTIRTKWMQFLEAYKRGDIMVSMGGNVYRTPDQMRYWNKVELDNYLYLNRGELKDVPRYVFAEDTKEVIHSKETMDTIEILKKFGKYRLPHKMCVAEYEGENPGIRLFAFCYEKSGFHALSPETTNFPFSVCLFAYYDFDNPELAKSLREKAGRLRTNQFAVIYPIIADMENIPGTQVADADSKAREVGGIRYQTMPVTWLSIAKMEDIPEAPFNKDDMVREYVTRAGFAIRALTSMMQTKGVYQDVIGHANLHKLNKKRALAKVSPVPDHVYVTLGHVYNKNGSTSQITTPTGRKLRFHMRAAHVKKQPYGPNNSLRKEIMVDAYLVNADQGGELYNPVRVVKA